MSRDLGVAEYLCKPLTRDLVSRILAPFLAGNLVAAGGPRGARVVTVSSLRGGAGGTTVAVNLALHLAAVSRGHVALLDLNLHGGTSAMMLGLKPGTGLRTALEQPDRVDALLLERLATPVQDRVRLIAAEEPLEVEIGAIEEGDLTHDHTVTLADQLGVTEREVTDMNRRLSGPDSSLNAPLRSESESEWQDWLADDTADQETRLAEREEMGNRHALLTGAMKDLTDRERDIIQARRLQDEPATLEELSQKYGVSRERVRQIEVRAFEKLQRGMKAAMNTAALPAPA
jgi:RNA polymerase sigma factor (sigma-70 family)